MKTIIYDYPYVFKDNHNEDSNVIFVHGFNSSPATFRIFEEYWKKSNYYAIQFPGNNNTNPVNGHEISVYQYAKLLVEFVEKNKLKNVTLIGHSMGGGTISLAYEMKPELFSKMIYIAPMNKSSLSTVDKYFETYFPKTFDQFLKFLEALYYDTTRFTSDSRWMNLTQKNFDANYFNNDNILKLGRSLPNLQLHNDIEKGLQAIKVPTLLILGEKDVVIDRDNCLRYFENNVEDIKTIYIPQTGHMMFEENWKSFISILEPFLLS